MYGPRADSITAGVQFPDPTPRPPAFAVNVDGNGPAGRPKSSSVAPYPTDDQPLPSATVRPVSSAPYPIDDVQGPQVNPSPHFAGGAPGPQADRPGSAFGIRPLSPNSGGLRPGSAGRGRPVSSQPGVGGGWDAQAAAGYRRPSPGPGGQWQQPPHGQHDPRYGDHGRGRLQKPNPNLQPTAQGGPPMGGGQPGRDYGRPVSDNYGAAPGGYDRYGPAPPGSPGRPPTGGPGSPGLHPSHAGPSARPVSHVDPGSGGRSSAPPAGANGRPGPPSSTASSPGPAANQQRPPPPSTRPSGASSTNLVHPDGKTMGNGPATFEEMGIPQGKNENDCVSFFFSYNWLCAMTGYANDYG